jgi:hypothetical protein
MRGESGKSLQYLSHFVRADFVDFHLFFPYDDSRCGFTLFEKTDLATDVVHPEPGYNRPRTRPSPFHSSFPSADDIDVAPPLTFPNHLFSQREDAPRALARIKTQSFGSRY